MTQFELQFTSVATKYLEEEKQQMTAVITAVTPGGWNVVTNPPGRLNSLYLCKVQHTEQNMILRLSLLIEFFSRSFLGHRAFTLTKLVSLLYGNNLKFLFLQFCQEVQSSGF